MKKQVGITLLEVVIALGIMSIVVAGTAALIDRSSADTRAAVAAQQLRTIGDAANAYIKDNYTAVTAIATASQPALIRVSDLVAGGYLTAGTTTTNAYQQNQCVLVLQPTANNLTAIVVTEGGTVIDDLTLGGIAGLVGAAGAGIYSTAATTVRGAMGGWSIATGNYANANNLGQHCDGTAGTVALAAGHPAEALWFANGNITSGFLYRAAVPSHPELNQMDTPLQLGPGTIQKSGTACAAADLGKLARDKNGKVLMCDGSYWMLQGSAFWADPVQRVADPDGAGPITGLSTTPCDTSLAGQTRMVLQDAAGHTLTPPRAYSCDGSSWKAVGIDDQGLLLIPGIVTVGAACPNGVADNGRVGRDTNGLLLSCQSGVWKGIGGSNSMYGGGWVNWSYGCYQSNPQTGGCSCPSGYNTVLLSRFHDNSNNDYYFYECWKVLYQ
jgi:type II secretory pathway pseudopilin PulG